jgi:hypothetical protein
MEPIHHIGRSHPIGEAKDGKISIIVRFLTYRQQHMVFSNKRKLKGNSHGKKEEMLQCKQNIKTKIA